ncbi:hypothetical protein ACWDE0_38670 [Streptomyces sp. 900105755]
MLAAAGRLLEPAVPGALDPGVRDRIVASTGGTPLALVEAAREPRAGQLGGGTPPPEPIPLGRALRERLTSGSVRNPVRRSR